MVLRWFGFFFLGGGGLVWVFFGGVVWGVSTDRRQGGTELGDEGQVKSRQNFIKDRGYEN